MGEGIPETSVPERELEGERGGSTQMRQMGGGPPDPQTGREQRGPKRAALHQLN